MSSDRVANDELLYRSVTRDVGFRDENGKRRPGSQAFADRQRKPSVDRAKRCNNDPTRTQMSPTDSVVSIFAYEVRGITNIVGRDEHGQEYPYAIDVIPDPRPD